VFFADFNHLSAFLHTSNYRHLHEFRPFHLFLAPQVQQCCTGIPSSKWQVIGTIVARKRKEGDHRSSSSARHKAQFENIRQTVTETRS
jgi:hypothetical protein